MIKEIYIQHKVIDFEKSKVIKRMEKDRKTHFICQTLSQEIDKATEKYKRHICTFAHKLIKENI